MHSDLIKALQMMVGMTATLIIFFIIMMVIIFNQDPEKEMKRREDLEKAKREFKNAILESWPVPQIINLFFRITGRYTKGVIKIISNSSAHSFIESRDRMMTEDLNKAFEWIKNVETNESDKMVIHMRNEDTLKRFIKVFSVRVNQDTRPLEIPVAYNSSVPRGEVWIINKTKQTIRKIIL